MTISEICRLVVAATFLLSAATKFLGGGDSLAGALRLSVPQWLARIATAAVTPFEFLVAALLLIGNRTTFQAGLVLAASLLLIFAGWMVSVLLRRLELRCSCFGPGGAAVGWRHVVRNLLLTAVALVGVVFTSSSPGGLGTSVCEALVMVSAALLIVSGVALRIAAPALMLSFEWCLAGSTALLAEAIRS